MIEFVPASEDLEGLTRGEVADLVVSNAEAEEAHVDLLNEIYGEVSICGLSYDAAYALKEVDPIAFRCSFADFVSENYVEIDLADFPESLDEQEA